MKIIALYRGEELSSYEIPDRVLWEVEMGSWKKNCLAREIMLNSEKENFIKKVNKVLGGRIGVRYAFQIASRMHKADNNKS